MLSMHFNGYIDAYAFLYRHNNLIVGGYVKWFI